MLEGLEYKTCPVCKSNYACSVCPRCKCETGGKGVLYRSGDGIASLPEHIQASPPSGNKVQSERNSSPEIEDVHDGLERDLQQDIEDYLRQEGLYFFHDRSRKMNAPGFPDLVIACWGGETLWWELKSKEGKPRKEQKLVRLQLLALGHEYEYIRSLRQAKEIIRGKKAEWKAGREAESQVELKPGIPNLLRSGGETAQSSCAGVEG